MKDYKENIIHLGSSDIASLLLRPCYGQPVELKLGGDGSYKAYVVEDENLIPEHYKKEFEFSKWLWVYDDNKKVAELTGEKIGVYRSGDFGILFCLEK